MERLSAVLGQAVQFIYACWDRIVLNGYIERLQRPENLIWFFHDAVGIEAIEPAVLEQRTNAYKSWVKRTTEDRGIPLLAAPKGVRKEELVQPYYRRLKASEGVACVLSSMEQGRTFVSYVPRWKVPSGDANNRFIKACRKQFLHYYWYVLDPVMGRMSVRVASYFPFNVTCYLNGHSFVAQELQREGPLPPSRQRLPGRRGYGRSADGSRSSHRCRLAAPLQLLGAASGAGLQSRRA